MNKKAIIFPYNIQSGPLIKHNDLLIEYDIVALVSPIGFGLVGKDASYAYNGENIGIKVYDSFQNIQIPFDTLIVSDVEIEIDFEQIIYPEILNAINNKKNIVCLHDINTEMYQKINELCIENNVKFKCFNIIEPQKNILEIDKVENEKLMDINVPIIFVAGFMEKTNKLDIQLSLRSYFTRAGYKISQIGTRNYCELFGFYSFPQFMYSNLPEWKKIIKFNRLCKEIEVAEKPDLMIIGIPGAIMPYNKIFTNKFGVLAFEIANAISPDAVVMSTLYGDYNKLYFESILTSVKYKLGFEIDCFNLSNNKFESKNSKENGIIDFVTVGTKLVDKKKNSFEEYDIPIFNSLNSKDSKEMSMYLEEKLSSYTNSQIL